MTGPAIDRSNVHLHAMPAALGETNLWRVTAVWHEVAHWERINVADIEAKVKFIATFADKIGIPFQHLIWLDSAIDAEVNEWITRNQESEILQRQVLLLLQRVNDQERLLANMDEALKKAETRLERIAEFCQTLREERRARLNGKERSGVENTKADGERVGA